MTERALLVAGLMSGTSADGIDCALVRLGDGPLLRAAQTARHSHVRFTPEQRRALLALFDPAHATADVLCRMNFEVGEWFGAAALAAMRAAGLGPEQLDLLGSHGQTVYHCPPRGQAGHVACTLQIGEPAVIAERTGVTTVADFRVRDVAAGGHGAPLVSYVDALLLRHPELTRVVLNLGGIANVTILPPAAGAEDDRRPPTAVAFDTGPGNMVLDWLAHQVSGGALEYDEAGRLAAAGAVDEGLLAAALAHPYFAAPPPKTTGREQFGAAYAERFWRQARERGLSAADTLATATALTAESVAAAIRSAAAGAAAAAGAPGAACCEVVAGGGGARNPVLVAELARRLPGVRVTTHEAYGISSQAKEALSFAILAWEAIRGRANTVPACTGARHPVVMGKIVPGANYVALMRRLFQDGAGA